jgi:hypothetical protein
MQRRELLRLLAGAVSVPALAGLPPERLLDLGRATHARGAAAVGGLSAHTSETIAAIAELVFPESDTPGARAVGVPDFIEKILADWQTDDERRQFLAGLDDLDRRSGSTFLALAADAQKGLLAKLDGARGEMGSAEASFATLKSLSLYGYFTSERVVTEVLRTPMIPGRYDGCVQMGSH